MFCMGLGLCIIDLTIATGWNTNDPAITLAVAGPAVIILLGLSILFAGKSRQSRAASPADHGPMPGVSHGT